MKLLRIILVLLFIISGCSLFKQKKFEDTDTYRELQKSQQESNKKIDSLTKIQLNRDIDSLRRASDSLEREINKTMEHIKKSDSILNKKINTTK